MAVKMDVWALIPVKSLMQSKRRLAHVLPPDMRARLISNLLDHVLSTIQETTRITRTVVISRDPDVWRIAEAHGVTILQEEGLGQDLNQAVAQANSFAFDHGAEAVLVLPADLPLVTPADIDLMIDATANGGECRKSAKERPLIAICSDRRNEGTNGLLLQPAQEFTFHYGTDSLQRHIREALEREFEVCLVFAPGLRFDLDTEEDWQRFAAEDRNTFDTYLPVKRLINT